MDSPLRRDEKTGLVLICAWHANPSKEELERVAAQLYPGVPISHICCPQCKNKLKAQNPHDQIS